ncbi:hypothetical protein RAS1_17060 [Phycisphaerae bacterium RAS1]|nr:hypothetical protein RAS1_17060 [Phycisphaerae bacterium RAS1]
MIIRRSAAMAFMFTTLMSVGCAYQNGYVRHYTLKSGGAKTSIDAYYRTLPTDDWLEIESAKSGAISVGMPEGLVRAICAERLRLSDTAWEVVGEFHSVWRHDNRRLYLYFFKKELAAIIIIGSHEGSPL